MCKPRLLDFQSHVKGEKIVNKVHVQADGLVERLPHALERTKSQRL